MIAAQWFRLGDVVFHSFMRRNMNFSFALINSIWNCKTNTCDHIEARSGDYTGNLKEIHRKIEKLGELAVFEPVIV